ncbi:uncharacterized protein LOC125208507 isoform X2 [Salvia hispanica]|uniref:uncharacterized protein LOC125208507 isoform X2 n=1 Tax=Salvia hispanica TaxID=49212 RepID=UPI00200908AF|nr:uncharacterized protein LOC125208507 isoform X2 [Salvia hispanica]
MVNQAEDSTRFKRQAREFRGLFIATDSHSIQSLSLSHKTSLIPQPTIETLSLPFENLAPAKSWRFLYKRRFVSESRPTVDAPTFQSVEDLQSTTRSIMTKRGRPYKSQPTTAAKQPRLGDLLRGE